MTTLSFSALTIQSRDPDRLAAFYRDTVGLPLAVHDHGPIAGHHEGDLGGVHLAVLKASPTIGGPFVPVFRVDDLDACCARLAARGVPALHRPLDLGEGKRVVTFSDPEGNAFRMIEII